MTNTEMNTPPRSVCAVDGQVVRRDALCREHIRLELRVASFPPSQPGQFLQLRCRTDAPPQHDVHDWPVDGFPSLDDADLHGRQAFLRRPFSIADHVQRAPDDVRLAVISRTVGVGTRWLEQLQPEDLLSLSGPFGRGFLLPESPLPVVLMGGGVGIPPLLYLARRLNERGFRDVTIIFGVTTRDLLPIGLTDTPATDGTATPCARLPGDAAYDTIITTDDGSLGLQGNVVTGLERWLSYPSAPRHPSALVLSCGPEGMLQAVARACRQHGLPCQLCIERHMGCGVGTCLSCVIRAYDDTRPEGWRWALACCDGPVFDRDALLDYNPPLQ